MLHHLLVTGFETGYRWGQALTTAVMDVPEIIGLYNVKSILTDNSI